MLVKQITKYVFKEKEYHSLKELKDSIENTIGLEVVDVINRSVEIKHKDLFVLMEILCRPEIREVLTECLNVEFEYNENEGEDFLPTEIVRKNILDIK